MSDFDLASAKPLEFDLASAQPVGRKPQSLMALGGQAVPINSPQAKEAASPVAGNSFLQNAAIGAGKYFTDLGLGARELYARAADTISPRAPTLSGLIAGQPSRTAAIQQAVTAKRQTDAPVMATEGGKVGQLGAGLLSSLPALAIPGANTYAGAAIAGGAQGALTPTTQSESTLGNTAVGAALGAAGKGVGDLAGRLPGLAASALRSRPLPPPNLTPAQSAALVSGQALGMRATPGQALGSAPLQQVEAKLESMPWTSGPFARLKTGNAQALNRTVAQSIGENSSHVDASVLDAADTRLGNIFDSVRAPSRIVMQNPQATTQTLNAIDQDFRGLLPGNGSIREANPLVADAENLLSQGAANGQQLGSLSSKLGKAAYKQMSSPSGDRDLGAALYRVKDHVDDVLESSLSGAEQAEYAAARTQYRNLMQITSRVGIVNPNTGNVSGASLANRLQQSDRAGFMYGRNQTPMYQAARFAQAFKPIVGDSGTATRSADFKDLALSVVGSPLSAAYMRSGPLLRAATNPGTLGRNALAATGRGAAQGLGVLKYLPPGAGGLLVPYLNQQ
jgi:hypothetical protein